MEFTLSSNQSIAELAYYLWNARGRPNGSEEEDWLEAERRLATPKEAGEEAGQEAARDSAAGHSSDLRSSNAGIQSNPANKKSTAGRKSRGGVKSTLKSAKASGSAGKATASEGGCNPPVDETDDAPRTGSSRESLRRRVTPSGQADPNLHGRPTSCQMRWRESFQGRVRHGIA